MAAGQTDTESLNVLAFICDQHLARGARGNAEVFGPAGAIVDEAARHVARVGLVVDIALAFACMHHRVIGLGPADTDAARFLDHCHGGVVLDPCVLIGQQRSHVWPP